MNALLWATVLLTAAAVVLIGVTLFIHFPVLQRAAGIVVIGASVVAFVYGLYLLSPGLAWVVGAFLIYTAGYHLWKGAHG